MRSYLQKSLEGGTLLWEGVPALADGVAQGAGAVIRDGRPLIGDAHLRLVSTTMTVLGDAMSSSTSTGAVLAPSLARKKPRKCVNVLSEPAACGAHLIKHFGETLNVREGILLGEELP